VSLRFTSVRNEKIEHYIRIKTRKSIILKFWVESDVKCLMWLDLSLIGVVSS